MKKTEINWKDLESLLEEMADMQRKQLLKTGRQIVPTLTPEDMLQPNDYHELEVHPLFRYEEGVMAGILSVQTALHALNP